MNKADGGTLSLLSILTLIFLALKLTDNIDWSWWWVFSPLWIPAAIVVVLYIIYLIVIKKF